MKKCDRIAILKKYKRSFLLPNNYRMESNMYYFLLALLLVASIAIIVGVFFQRTTDSGLSSTIAGGSDTYYGKDKSSHSDRLLHKIILIASIVFVAAVLVTYVIQPDYTNGYGNLENWKNLLPSVYKDVFK